MSLPIIVTFSNVTNAQLNTASKKKPVNTEVLTNKKTFKVNTERVKKIDTLTYGVRPLYLIDDMDESQLKKELQQCSGQTPKRTAFSIAHRGAPMQFPEHTVDGYKAALRMGVGVMECDVTFTKDKELVCRHAQNDLHTTTNIVSTDGNGNMVASEYAKAANKAGLKIITWTVERSGPLANGGGWYYSGLKDATNNDGDMMNYIDVLAQQVGVIGIFSDWLATVTYYANCKGL